MGLDMYLNVRKSKYHSQYTQSLTDKVIQETASALGTSLLSAEEQFDAIPSVEITLEQSLAYWRKHPNLHGYIVENFAEGIDDCRPIYLWPEAIEQIIEAIENDELPSTTGFFFGASPSADSDDPEEREWAEQQKAHDLAVFRKALDIMNTEEEAETRIVYQASW